MSAPTKRKVVGSVVKGKEGKPPYIKIREAISLNAGDFLRLESKKTQLDALEAAAASGKLTGDIVESIRERINKMPDFVLFDVVQLPAIKN